MLIQSLEEIWRSLEAELPSSPRGCALARRLHPESPRDIRVAVDPVTHSRMLLVRIASSALDPSAEFPRSRGFELRFVPLIDDDSWHVTLGVVLSRPDHADVFTSLVADVAFRVSRSLTDREAAIELIGRLLRWQAFLQRHQPDGLGVEAQRGLYGELWFLRYHLIPRLGPRNAVSYWTGPGSSNHDFQIMGCAVEIKTSTGKQHQHLHIASERQLDDTGTVALLLFHLSLDEREGAGETLPAMVSAVRVAVASDQLAREEYESQLIEAGYLDPHESRYSSRGYSLRQSSFYRVRTGFPRIVEQDLRPGVGDVRYTLSVAACEPFAVSEGEAQSLWEATHES